MTRYLIIESVNEDGDVYDTHETIEDALRVLDDFPNDHVRITKDCSCIGPSHAHFCALKPKEPPL